MQGTDAKDIKFEVVPGDELDKHGLFKIRDPFNRYFPIAIVGIGVHMPDADDVPAFEKVLDEERCVLQKVPSHRWCDEDYYSADPTEKGRYCITRLGFYDKFFHFDPLFFNMSRRETYYVDPMQRQVLSTTEHALQDAGILPEKLPKDTGVYIGMGIIDTPGTICENRHMFNAHTVNGFAHSCAATRVSHHYGLTGPSCAVDTACAASLTALHVACMSMWNGECSMALTGATSHVYSPECVVAFSQLGVLSSTGNCAPFDISNNGYVRSEGTGIVVLKNIEDAIRDGDHIYCAIRGTTSAHNGYSMSLTLPSAPAQEELIRRCYDQFGVDLGRIPYVEAHGTGTPVGDPIETRALGNTFGKSRPKDKPLRIASAKSNFGHLEVAAGMVQIVKTAIMLKKRKFFKHINWTKPNHRINMEESNLVMQLKNEPYTNPENFMIGVNTFGFGGSLVHQILEEVKMKEDPLPEDRLAGWSFGSSDTTGRKIAIPFSAKTDTSLKNFARRWMEWEDELDAQRVMGWLATRREHYPEHRLAVLADSGADFRKKLGEWLKGETQDQVFYSANGRKMTPPEVCFLFPGWGQQWFDMGRSLYANEPFFKETVDNCDTIFKSLAGYSALEKYQIFIADGKADPETINKDACKPAILFFQIALAKLLEHWGIAGIGYLGVGLGELSAAFASGAVSLENAIKCMYVRMSAPPKEEFLKNVRTILDGAKELPENFYSTITGEKYTGALDADYWWRNVVEKPNVAATVEAIKKNHSNVIFLEVGSDAVLSPVVLEKEAQVISCGVKNKDDWTQLLGAVVSLHVKGVKINWENQTRRCAKYAPIPLYAYDETEYVMESINYNMRKLGQVDRSYRACYGKIDILRHPHLKYYILDEAQVFPLAGYIEYFSEYHPSTLCSLKNVKLYENLVVPGLDTLGHFGNIIIDMEEDGANLRAVYEKRVLAEAQLGTGTMNSEQPSIDIEAIKARCGTTTDGEKLFARFASLGLNYGMHYKSLQQMYIGDDEVLAYCKEQHPMNRWERIETVILECVFQAAIGVFTRGDSLYIATHVKQLQMFVEKCPYKTRFVVYAKMKECSLKTLTCDLTIADLTGKAWLTITDFRATSRSQFDSNARLSQCVYTPKWQMMEAQFSDAPTVESPVLEIPNAQAQMTCFNDAISSQCAKALANVTESETPNGNKEFVTYMKKMAKSANNANVSSENPSVEEQAIADMAANFPAILSGNTASDDALKTVLRESPVLQMYYKAYSTSIKAEITEALKKKQVVRICEIGTTFGAFTKHIVQALEKEFGNNSVDYTFVADEEIAKDVDAYLSSDGNICPVKYDRLDREAPIKDQVSFAAGFDMVIQFSIGKSDEVQINQLADLLINGGKLAVLRSQEGCGLLSFLACSPNNKPLPLNESGFIDTQSYGADETHMLSLTIGRLNKAGKKWDIDGDWIIIPNGQENLANSLISVIQDSPRISSLSDIGEVVSKKDQSKHINVAYFLGKKNNTWREAHRAIDTLKNRDWDNTLTLWCINVAGSTHNAAFGLIRAMRNDVGFDIKIVHVDTPEGPETSKAKAIVEAMTRAAPGDNEVHFTNGGCRVPRLMRLPTNAGSATSESSALKTDEAEVLVKAMSKMNNEDDSLVVFAGIVRATGSKVEQLRVGDAVMGVRSSAGKLVIANEESLFRKPPTSTFSEAVEALYSYTSAYLGLVDKIKIKQGDTVLCTSPDDSFGRAALQIARMRGAKLISTFGKDTNCNSLIQDLKAIALVNPESLTFKEEIHDLTDGKGIDVTLKTNGEALPEAVLDCMSGKSWICSLGVSKSTSVNVPNVRQTLVNPTAYFNTTKGMKKIQGTVKEVAELLNAGSLSPKFQGLGKTKLSTTSFEEEKAGESSLTEIQLDDTATYLVTGGFGRLGQEVARWLADRGARHIAIASRQRALNNFDIATIRYLQSQGCSVYQVTADVSNQADVKRIFSELASKDVPKLKGIFHVVGETTDILDDSVENIERMMKSQTGGARMLHQESLDLSLDHFVMFSTAAGTLGIPQLSALATCTGFLDGLAEIRRGMGLPGLSFQMGFVRGVGAISDNQEACDVLKDAGMTSLHFVEYLSVLGNLLQSQNLPAVVMVSNQDWSVTSELCGNNTMWMRHLLAGGYKSSDTGGMSKRDQYELLAKELIAKMTCAALESIESSLPVQAFGVDSLMSQEIVSWAEKVLKVKLEQSQVFAGLTINQLMDMAFA